MAQPILHSSPARARLWAGFWFVALTALFSSLPAPIQAAGSHDDPTPGSDSPPSPSPTLDGLTATVSATPLPNPTIEPQDSVTPTLLATPSAPAPLPSDEPSPTPSATPPSTQTSSPLPTTALSSPAEPQTYPAGAILISEVAWAGTLASAHDEWIELFNPGGETIDLSGWVLSDDSDIHVQLSISIAPYSFALLERTDDTTVASILADQIYTGGLNNGGEALYLRDPSGGLVDSANAAGGNWPAGDSSTRASMERRGGADQSGNWATFAGHGGLGHDANGNPIAGTPRGVNSIHLPNPASPTPSATPSAPSTTATLTSVTPPAQAAPLSVVINEVAWAGTRASANDEWIELHNPGDEPFSLKGWTLLDGGDILVELGGTISPHGYFLLERTDDTTVANITADLIYSGSLSNAGETLRLLDPAGRIIDSANLPGGSWPAGNLPAFATMERSGGEDHPGNWATFNGFHGVGVDTEGNPIQGTPRQINSIFFPTPQPTWIPGKIVINEVLIRPHYDWEGTGGVDTGDEFIELLNLGPFPVNLRGWMLDDLEGAGSKPYKLPSKTLKPGAYLAFFRSRTGIALNDGGDTARIIDPDGRLVDQITYLRVRAYNLSYGRLPDGSGNLAYGLWPTPGDPNLLFAEPLPTERALPAWHCQQDAGFRLSLARFARRPMQISRLSSAGYRFCWIRG